VRVLIDACVLFPTVPRALLLGSAGAGLIAPLWSTRILEEWRRAVLRAHPEQGGQASAEIASARAAFPDAEIAVPDGMEDALSLPDENDRHVLAAALAGRAELLVTRNLRDFPPRTLARHGVQPRAPDSLLLELLGAHPGVVAHLAAPVLEGMGRASGLGPREILKRSGLPRFGKALEAAQGG
jgi:predicted nucleic acid-binding protein